MATCVTWLRERAEDSKRKDLTQRTQRGDAEGAETSCTKCASLSLTEVGDFFVEVGESGFEGLAMVGMSGGGEVVGYADT